MPIIRLEDPIIKQNLHKHLQRNLKIPPQNQPPALQIRPEPPHFPTEHRSHKRPNLIIPPDLTTKIEDSKALARIEKIQESP